MASLSFDKLVSSRVFNKILGKYLIKKFDIKNRYPKIANFIQSRLNFKTYYFYFTVIIFLFVIV